MSKRVFICFAVEDKQYRDFLRGQARNERSPFEFVDMSVKEPWATSWKTKCRTRLRGCDGAIALLSSNTRNADGALWEMSCAVEENIPIIGVQISKDRPAPVPSQLRGKRVINWSWSGIESFVNSL